MIRTRPNAPDFDRWTVDFQKAAINQRHAMWAIGDLLLFGLEHFDENKVWIVAEVTGHQYQTLANYKAVAKAFPQGERRLNIPFGVHAELVALNDTDRQAFLDAVEAQLWPRATVRERVRAWRKGVVEAIKPSWKPVQKTIEVKDDDPSFTAGGKEDDDKPIFDSTGFGEGQDAERREKLDAYAEQDLNDANQTLLNALGAVERACAHSNTAHLNMERIDQGRIRSAIKALQDLLPREHKRPTPRPVTLKQPDIEPMSPPPAPPLDDFDEIRDMPDCLRRFQHKEVAGD